MLPRSGPMCHHSTVAPRWKDYTQPTHSITAHGGQQFTATLQKMFHLIQTITQQNNRHKYNIIVNISQNMRGINRLVTNMMGGIFRCSVGEPLSSGSTMRFFFCAILRDCGIALIVKKFRILNFFAIMRDISYDNAIPAVWLSASVCPR